MADETSVTLEATSVTLDVFQPTVEARKITDEAFLQEIMGFILDKESTMTLKKIYRTGHSPMRTQLFLFKMEITTEVSVHLVRHAAVGQFHYVSSHREDWSESKPEDVNRLTPVRHVMLLNAQHVIEMCGARLCTKSLPATREVARAIREAVRVIDPELAHRLQPKCFAQGGQCTEDGPCGQNLVILKQIIEQVPEEVYRKWRNDFLMDNYETP